jgi:hypothetical protein
MPAVICTTVYQIDELSPKAKDNARIWYRSQNDDDWWDYVYEDFREVCHILGISVKNIWFSGFSCQGDGACFEGFYNYQPESVKKIREHAPQDTQLQSIAKLLQAMQKRNFYQLTARMTHRGRYYHPGCMDVEVEGNRTDDDLIYLMRELAHWLYRQLETEYDYLNSDEAVDESISANEYTFTESGRRFG